MRGDPPLIPPPPNGLAGPDYGNAIDGPPRRSLPALPRFDEPANQASSRRSAPSTDDWRGGSSFHRRGGAFWERRHDGRDNSVPMENSVWDTTFVSVSGHLITGEVRLSGAGGTAMGGKGRLSGMRDSQDESGARCGSPASGR